MKTYEVSVLKTGYAIWKGPTQQQADGTITLIKGPKNIVVDTGSPWDKRTIIERLKRQKVSSKDIDFVICTHGHSDHIGNNNLFSQATFIVSYDVCKGDLYTFHDFASGQAYRIDDQVEVVPTPGHSKQDISVVVQTPYGVVAVVGDLFEDEHDLVDENRWRSFSELPQEQESSRKRILEVADFIVPGHGKMFAIKQEKSSEERLTQFEPTALQKDNFASKLLWKILIPLLIAIAGVIFAWHWNKWCR